jgi:polysaccharide export outer membrane protein
MEQLKLSSIKTQIIALVVTLAILSACVSQKNVTLVQEKVNKEMKTDFANQKSTSYRVQPGDHLYVRIYSIDPKTSKFFQSDFPYLMNSTYQYLNTYVVDEYGYISFSFIEKIFVKGLSVSEIQKALQDQLNQYFKEATAYVKLVNFQVGNYTVEQDQLSVFQALGIAGGITDFGNLKQVKLIRQISTGSEIHLLDLTDNLILESPYYYLLPGDVIYIEPRNTKSWVYSQFPYQSLLYFFSTIILGAALFMK